MASPQPYDWREIVARLALSGDRDTPSTLDNAPTRRVLHSNMLRLPNANGWRLRPMHEISFLHSPEKRRHAKFVPFGIWRMMFVRRLAWVRMNDTSPDILAALNLDLNGLPTTENMAPDVFDNGTHIFDGRHDNFIDLFLPIDEIWNKLKTPTNQPWIQDALLEDRIHLKNLQQLRTILQGTTQPPFRHEAFGRALSDLFNADGSPISNDNPIKFLQDLMDLREEIVADLAVIRFLQNDGMSAHTFFNGPGDVVHRMARYAGPGIRSDSPSIEAGPSDSPGADPQPQFPRLEVFRLTWNAACQRTRHPHHQVLMDGTGLRQTARRLFKKFMKEDRKATEQTLAEMDLWI